MAKTQIVRYDNFKAGEFGNLGASAAPENSFTGVNIMRYRSGLIGPRPGFRLLTDIAAVAGKVWGLRGVGSRIVYGQARTVNGFTWSRSSAAVSAVTNFTDTVSGSTNVISSAAPANPPCQIIQYGKKAVISVAGFNTYLINATAGTSQRFTDSMGGKVVAVSGERVIVGNSNTTVTTSTVDQNYIRGSTDNINSWATWPTAAFYEVSSDDWEITYIDEIRNRTIIANTGQEWWTQTGDMELDPTIKRTVRADVAPAQWYNATRLGETIYFVPFGEDFPVEFIGTVTDKLRHRNLTFTKRSDNPITVSSLPSSDCIAFIEGSAAVTSSALQSGGTPRMLMRMNDTWTYHRLGISSSLGTVSDSIPTLVTPASQGGLAFNDNPFILCDGGDTSTIPKFYVFDPVLDRPGKVADTTAAPGDGSDTTPVTAEVSFPEYWTPDGQEVIVRSVSVDFAKWNWGNAGKTNHFDVEIKSLHRDNTSGTRTSQVVSFDEDCAKTTADETPDRRIFRVGDQGVGHGFILRFSNIRGVAFRRVIVELNLDPRRQ